MNAINRKVLLDVLDKYIPRLVASGIIFVRHPEFDLDTASEGRIYRYIRALKIHLKVLRRSHLDDEELVLNINNFNADISAVYRGVNPPHLNTQEELN